MSGDERDGGSPNGDKRRKILFPRVRSSASQFQAAYKVECHQLSRSKIAADVSEIINSILRKQKHSLKTECAGTYSGSGASSKHQIPHKARKARHKPLGRLLGTSTQTKTKRRHPKLWTQPAYLRLKDSVPEQPGLHRPARQLRLSLVPLVQHLANSKETRESVKIGVTKTKNRHHRTPPAQSTIKQQPRPTNATRNNDKTTTLSPTLKKRETST